MIKLLIADDEKIIRETIASLIDWNSLGISLIGTAENGIEAYNMILDDYPDIVLTDIKMPGLSGLDLIQRIHEINPDTQFVILSGYGEFKFAQRAMQYGVKHYLLKPCNEEQIIESLMCAKEDYLETISSRSGVFSDSGVVNQIMIKNILTYYLQTTPDLLESSPSPYQSYTDLKGKPYTLFYIYYIGMDDFLSICCELSDQINEKFPRSFVSLFYVKGTMICFFPSDSKLEKNVTQFLNELKQKPSGKLSEFECQNYDSLHLLMQAFIRRLKNYEIIYQIINHSALPVYNYHSIVKEMYRLTDLAFSPDHDAALSALDALFTILDDISDPDLLKQQASSLIIYAVSRQTAPDMTEPMKYLLSINQLDHSDSIRLSLRAKLTDLFKSYHASNSQVSVSQRIISYTEQNLEKPGLSLKWIAENYLFMNVDYLSKRFVKETGMKFSKYLNDLRIQKAKHYMELGTYNVQEVAELVGCGQNPQYFSQIFKKNTGLSPSQYLARYI